MDIAKLKKIIEGALFAAERPLNMGDLLKLFESDVPEKKEMRDALEALREDYENRGIELKELASGFQFQVTPELSQWVQRLWEEKPARYSRAFLETLALVAYRQPLTRGEISEVRGVTVSPNIMRTLIEHEWIHVVGYRDVPGKPGLYATTKKFLDDFGLKSLKELPDLPEIEALLQVSENNKQLELSDVEEPNDAEIVESLEPADLLVESEESQMIENDFSDDEASLEEAEEDYVDEAVSNFSSSDIEPEELCEENG